MQRKTNNTSHVSTADTLWEDMGFSPAEAAVMELKYKLHSEIEKEIKRQKLTRKQVGRILDIEQPHVSDLFRGKITKMSSDRLTKYLRQLGRQVKGDNKKSTEVTGNRDCDRPRLTDTGRGDFYTAIVGAFLASYWSGGLVSKRLVDSVFATVNDYHSLSDVVL